LTSNDPSPPATSPLSLHDALPISSSSAWEPLLRRIWGEALQTRTRVAFQPGDWDRGHLRNLQKAVPVGFSLRRIAAGDAARFSRDRKSTRLNSSHVSISYAVFCLK